jgi:hypothetical protein
VRQKRRIAQHPTQGLTQLHAVEPNGGWSDPHLSLSGLLALLLLDQLRAHALPRLRGVLPSRLSCTLPARSRLLGACGVFELPQHLRHLMMTALVAELEGCDSTISI